MRSSAPVIELRMSIDTSSGVPPEASRAELDAICTAVLIDFPLAK